MIGIYVFLGSTKLSILECTWRRSIVWCFLLSIILVCNGWRDYLHVACNIGWWFFLLNIALVTYIHDLVLIKFKGCFHDKIACWGAFLPVTIKYYLLCVSMMKECYNYDDDLDVDDWVKRKWFDELGFDPMGEKSHWMYVCCLTVWWARVWCYCYINGFVLFYCWFLRDTLMSMFMIG